MTSLNTLQIDPDAFDPGDLAPAIDWLRRGGIVAMPTDTFYGLAVDPTSDAAVAALFDLKGRSPRAALPLIGASAGQIERWCGLMTSTSHRLAAAYWPGPLSLIFDAPVRVAVGVHGGGRSVAVRVPDHVVARALAEAFGMPITATSANLSGERPARDVASLGVVATDARVLVVDAGVTPGGAPSTIVDARASVPVLVREGAVPWNRVVQSLEG